MPNAPENFVSLDATLLARQTEKIDHLTKSVEDLAIAIGERPTKLDIALQRRRTVMFSCMVIAVAAFLFGWLFVQQGKINANCNDRNTTSARFQVVLDIILEPQLQQNPESLTPEQRDANERFRVALKAYRDSLKQIKC